MINYIRINKINKLSYSSDVNCWGSTLYALDIENRPKWLDIEAITEFVSNNTKKITGTYTNFNRINRYMHNKLEVGDILVIENDIEILHTAIYLGNRTFWHKAGSLQAESCDIEPILDLYHYCHGATKFYFVRKS